MNGRTDIEFYVPVRLMKSAGAGEMRIGGFATVDDTIDLDQQMLDLTGVIDSIEYLTHHGKVNWNHGSDPSDMLGDIVVARPLLNKAAGRRGLWIEAILNPKMKKARDAYSYMDGGGKLGFSVQGVTLDLEKASKDGIPVGRLRTNFISQVALTPEPKCHLTFAQALKSLETQAIRKALSAGAGTDHSQFTGGRSLVKESLGSPSTEDIALLARYFRQVTGGVRERTPEFDQAFISFVKQWGLTPPQAMALAQHLGKRRP